jgi:hypothetical protein
VAGRIDTSTNKWWEAGKHLPNLHEIHDTPDFLAALGNAGDKLVIVDFYAQWCVVFGVGGITGLDVLHLSWTLAATSCCLDGWPLNHPRLLTCAMPPRPVCERRSCFFS